jgi:multidrug efflux pump subunit AcrB
VVREWWKLLESAKYVVCKSFSTDKNTDQKFLYNYADINVLSELKRVNGVGSGDILGTREYAYLVETWSYVSL